MPKESIAPLPIPSQLTSQPARSDSSDQLSFSVSETVTMVIGDGQQVQARAKGAFSIQTLTRSSAILSLFGLKVYDPTDTMYTRSLHSLASFTTTVACEQGMFAWKRLGAEGTWSDEEWPCLLFRVRYVFEVDPLHALKVMVATDQSSSEEQRRGLVYYYHLVDQQEVTMGTLEQVGITPSAF